MPDGLAGYCSPILRAAIFHRLHPGSQIEYDILPIEEAYPVGHREYEGKATEAVQCRIFLGDGSVIEAFKEIDLKDSRNRDIPQTPENLQKDQSKALGRALRDAGIPQKIDELRILMNWIVQLDSRAPQVRTIDRVTGEISTSDDPDNVDDPDAGSDDPTPQQLWAQGFSSLSGADKALLTSQAREELGIANIMRPDEDKIEALEALKAALHQQANELEEEF